MFVFPVYSIVFWWFCSQGWDTSLHDSLELEVLEVSPPRPQPQHYHNHHHHNHQRWGKLCPHNCALHFWGFHIFHFQFFRHVSNESFVFHIFCQASVPTTHSGNIWAMPCLGLVCCSSSTSNVPQEKRFSASKCASVWPIEIMCLLSYSSFRCRSGCRLGCLVGSNETMLLGSPSVEKSWGCLEQSLRLRWKTKSTNQKG